MDGQQSLHAKIAIAVAATWFIGMLVVRTNQHGTLDAAVLFDVVFAPLTLLLVGVAVVLTIRARRSRPN